MVFVVNHGDIHFCVSKCTLVRHSILPSEGQVCSGAGRVDVAGNKGPQRCPRQDKQC